MTDSEQIEYNQFIAQLRPMLDESVFKLLWAEFRTMMVDLRVDLALN